MSPGKPHCCTMLPPFWERTNHVPLDGRQTVKSALPCVRAEPVIGSCQDAPVEALMLIAAFCVPVLSGENITVTVQLCCAAMLTPHVFPVIAKAEAFVPVTEMAATDRAAVPLFVTEMFCALTLRIFWLPKFKLPGAKAICGLPMPVPVIVTTCGESGALSVKVRKAVRVPSPVGEKTTEAVQFDPSASVPAQVVVSLKSAALGPDKAAPKIDNARLPLSVRLRV